MCTSTETRGGGVGEKGGGGKVCTSTETSSGECFLFLRLLAVRLAPGWSAEAGPTTKQSLSSSLRCTLCPFIDCIPIFRIVLYEISSPGS